MVQTPVKTVAYEAVIGLEVHAQVLTRSKMFCGCAADYQSAAPNTRVCPVCMGMPGVLPVINKAAVEATVLTGLALHCTIAERPKFDRKNYPYPDLVKGYQISQYDLPISAKGWLEIDLDGERRRAGITRVHLEEDTAKLLHRSDPSGESYSLIDLNRSGTPLMEIVGEPDLRSAEEARQYLMKLRTILQYLGVSTGNMEEGSFRCDANVSVRPVGSTAYGTKVEVKNMNSFRSVYRALQFEVQRQQDVLQSGGRVVQETRGWSDAKGATQSQRSKEQAHDYRYFPEPDLPPLHLEPAWVEQVRSRLPELPDARRDRFQEQYGLSLYDARLLVASKALAEFFERTVAAAQSGDAKSRAKGAANWLLGEVSRLLNAEGVEIDSPNVKIGPEHVAEIVDLLEHKTVNQTVAKEAMEEAFRTGKKPSQIVQERGATQITTTEAIAPAVDAAIEANPQAVKDYLAGKETAVKFLVGQVMKATKGRANPTMVQEMLTQRLSARKA
ncbi:MAG: Asp-tRNA(Asn)/Glu-tRNA(Gln) amidotransferase subunit GatB [Dehalococcoidia bacterium]|nr:Asp-tRNA(Asn)/Glu-tRNA(Gln) amidotransferase subunit GatB [Dehalococcoidia bacterium]